MASPFWKYPSVLNGRIDPQYADAQSLESGYTGVYYFGSWFFYTYSYVGGGYYSSSYTDTYTDESGHVFCLGEDSNIGQDYRIGESDYSSVYQANIDLTDIDFIYFAWKLHNPASMPLPQTILSAGSCSFVTTDVVRAGDALPGILLDEGASPLFQTAHSERIVRVSGATTPANNGDFRISGVPRSQWNMTASPSAITDIENGRFAVIENASIVAEAGSAVTIVVLGAGWVARGYVDDILRCELREPGCVHHYGHNWQRNSLSAHVSKLSGTHTIKFELSVELLAS